MHFYLCFLLAAQTRLCPENAHAFLIMAHGQPAVLLSLLQQLDNERSCIFLHLDAKVADTATYIPQLQRAQFYMVPTRINGAWGQLSLVEIEYTLFSFAIQYGPFQRYHLLSGQDLLLKPINTLLAFFDDSNNNRQEFLEMEQQVYGYRLKRMRPENIWRVLLDIGEIKFGSQWMSLTEKAVNLLLAYQETAVTAFNTCIIPDESYKHTILWNSRDELQLNFTNLRLIKWSSSGRGPLELTHGDILKSTENPSLFFARKFDQNQRNLINFVLQRTIDQV